MNLILLGLLAVLSTPLHPFASSDISVSLSSCNSTLEVPYKVTCSCQLDVFSVYNNSYFLQVRLKEGSETHVRAKLRSTSECRVSTLNNQSAVFAINNPEFNGYEITEKFLIDFYSPAEGSELNCEGIEEKGEERLVYLVNRTKE